MQNDPAIYVPLTLLAAFGFAAAAVLQQAEAARHGQDTPGGGVLLLRLLARPLWLLGLAAYIAAYALQVWAVSLGPVVIIQPLIASQLVFALVLGTLFMGRHATRGEWWGAVAVTAGLAGFIIGTDPSHGHPGASASSWILASGLSFLALVLAMTAGARVRGATQSTYYGAAAGLCWGFMIVLMKEVTHGLDGAGGLAAIADLLGRPFVYGLVVTAIGGFAILQKAFQAGSLTHALVSYTVIEIVLAVGLGILLFDEQPHSDPLSLVVTGASFLAMVAGIVMLAGAANAEPKTRGGPD